MTDHIDQIMTVMSGAFDPLYGEAWTRRQVVDALTLGNCHYHLADADGRPILAETAEDTPEAQAAGFWMSRTGYEEEELLLLAVLPQYRGRGVGMALLGALQEQSAKRGARRLLLEMRKGNPAETLYRRFGFYSIGERRDYYRTAVGNRLDAVTFAYDMPASDVS